MSAYNVVWPSFWDSRTGRALVRDVTQGRFENGWLAMYLMTCKHANILGCFSMPLLYIQRDAGLTVEQAEAGLSRLTELEWLQWDGDCEFVWVREMARFRLNLNGREVSTQDNRITAAQHIFAAIPSAPLVEGIFDRYGKELKLIKRAMRGGAALRSPLPAPSKRRSTASGTVPNSTVQNSTKRESTPASKPRAGHHHHAYCSDRYCVPRTLHEEFVGQVGGANLSLLTWYADVIAELGSKPCVDELFPFWKKRFQRDIVPKLRVAGAVDMLPVRPGGNGPIDRMQARGRSAGRCAPIEKRTFTKGGSA